MKKIICFFALIGFIAGSIVISSANAQDMAPATKTATTHHHAKPHHLARHVAKKKKSPAAVKKAAAESKVKERVKTAQTHLIHLSYLKGKADGVLGAKTKAALKKFQKHNNIIANGKLTDETYKALEVADPSPAALKAAAAVAAPAPIGAGKDVGAAPAGPPEFYTKHPDFYGYYDQHYENAMQMGPPSVPTRYGRIDVHERTDNDSVGYDITVNDQPLFNIGDQPSVIGISRTYSMESEDLVIFTTYRAQSDICAYKNFLLVMNAQGSKTLEIPNCTRGYQAKAEGNDLFITFPETDSAAAIGATFRYEDGRILKL